MTAEPFRILTVCIGNMCRSPLAERLLRLRLADAASSGAVAVDSAGVGAGVGSPMEELAAGELTRLGGDPTGFRARQVSADIIGAADLVLCATRDIRTRTLQEQPRVMKRAFTFIEFAGLCRHAEEQGLQPESAPALVAWAATHRGSVAGDRLDIDDPIGLGAEVHTQVANQIDEQVTVIVAALAPLL